MLEGKYIAPVSGDKIVLIVPIWELSGYIFGSRVEILGAEDV